MDNKEDSQQPVVPTTPESGSMKPGTSILEMDEFRISNPKEIGVILKQLMLNKDFLVIASNNSQNIVVTNILNVNVAESLFFYDWGGNQRQNQVLLKSPKNYFSATQNGASVQFECGAPEQDSIEGMPVFRSAFPQFLYRMQRRRFFRAETSIANPYHCTVNLPGRGQVRFNIADLSITGVGLRSKDAWLADVAIGTMLKGAVLDFRGQGKLVLDLEVASLRDKRAGESSPYHVGCRLPNLPGAQEAALQRIITYLEFARNKPT